MKITFFVINLCSVFIFLTLGSLFTIVALHLVSYEDVRAAVDFSYQSPWKLLQLGFLGFLMIVLGLAYAKTLIKSTEGSAVVYESRSGQIRVASEAIEEAIRKLLKKHTVIRSQKIKISIDYQNVEVKIKLVLWTGVNITDFVKALQSEAYTMLSKLLGSDGQIQIVIDVAKVLSHEPEMVVPE